MQTTNQQIDTETNIAFHPTSQGTELLQNRGIADYIERHQGAAESIRRAAELLSGKPDAFKSLSKLLPALTNKTVNVFFSYKAKDEKTARAVVDILRKNSAGKLAITYQAEFVVEDVLQELLPLNKRFLNMTAERFGALVSTTP